MAADLPGLIEGAHRGKGLGLQFLRHVERTRAIALLVDASAESPRDQVAEIERELGQYSPALLEKPRVTVLTKADLLAPELRAGAAAAAGLPDALLISAHSGEGMPALLERLWKLIATERADEPAIHG